MYRFLSIYSPEQTAVSSSNPWVIFAIGAGVGSAVAIISIYIFIKFFKAPVPRGLSIVPEGGSAFLEEMNESLLIDNIELQNQKERLDLENQVLTTFSEEIDHKRKQIEFQQKEISSSINYASVIQNALFPSEDLLNEIFNDYFVFFRPRDTVSGDFYYVRRYRTKTVLVIADCTGHGVPGAFLSVLGFSLLEQTLATIEDDSAAVLMNRLRRIFKSTLGQNRLQNTNRDSIDMGLIIIDSHLGQLNFAGANNDLFFIRTGEEPEICKGDRMPVGVHENDFVPFRDYYLRFVTGDSVYLFTDGYPDQFGGQSGKKYGKQRFKDLLYYIHDLPMAQQKHALDTNLNDWMNDPLRTNFQVDDILVAGVRL